MTDEELIGVVNQALGNIAFATVHVRRKPIELNSGTWHKRDDQSAYLGWNKLQDAAAEAAALNLRREHRE